MAETEELLRIDKPFFRHRGFVDSVNLKEFPEIASDLLLGVSVPTVRCQAIRPIVVFVESDVVWAFEF